MIKPANILIFISIFSSLVKATSYVEGPDGEESIPIPERTITYKGYQLSIGEHGDETEYIEALNCISESIESGNLYGKRWINLHQRYTFVKIPMDTKVIQIEDIGKNRSYSAKLGQNEFSYIIEIDIKGRCTITYDDLI